MQTAKRVMILLAVALTGVPAMAMQTGQDNSAKSQQPAQHKLSETRFASCIVRITVDPVIVPLDPATVQGLLYSSGVAGAAVREVMQRDSIDNPWEELIETEWLNESSAWPSPTAASLDEEAAVYDRQMMQELERIYGEEYVKQMARIGSRTPDRQNQPAGGSADSMRPRATRPRGTPPAPVSPARSAPGGAPSATIKLSVRLPESVPPVADEFLRAVISNLRSSLSHAYEVHLSDLSDQLEMARRQHDRAVDTLQGGTDPAAIRIMEQLEMIVDLSVLTPEMPLSEAVDILKKSVEPPLNIVVLWNDLMDSLSVEPSTPINIDGMRTVKLRTGLDLLIKGIRSNGPKKAMWRIKSDVIIVATAASLGESGEPVGQPKVEIDVQALATQRNGLMNKLQDLELNLAGQEARREAIAEQIARTQAETRERLLNDDVTRELESLLKRSEENLSNLRKQAVAGRAPTAEFGQATESLSRAKIELAKRREELGKQVGGGQLDQLNSEMGRIAIDRAEKEAQRGILATQLAQVQQQLAQASRFDPEAARTRMAREGLDILARRIAELQMRVANLQPPMVTTIGAN